MPLRGVQGQNDQDGARREDRTPSPCHHHSRLTLQALCLHTEPILTADLEAQMWASPFGGLVLFVLWGWRLFLRA